ncbi:glucose/quinate/shikimate family membrane-bound PQQ-dependent dehydrogenase [Roseomonas sp. M0104]|uniref:Glucose/quinate/shikimate family membrane-bound PQQ-dependent dehydrogenase n=1 Tax=Teichococcus coralli TaxID=2545983 RepID=A0A845B5T5_9PROT|nr:glucose/quinate/shikimate family membrane-bound PQQ-dependent dehydrogenase [Pseudoroseomonas coralli]MXP62561.1 glucose/quinate/shikimate family membrane-bound PQQ-dependent dehydrogenase [Pseudoroseomonas coralli]
MRGSQASSLLLWGSGLVILLIGLALGAAGTWLILLGGSWYYAITGLAFAATGALLMLRSPLALWLYALVVLGSVLWAWREIGLDWWQLAPRGDVIFIIGLYLLMPWITRPLRRREAQPALSWTGAALPLLAALALGGAYGVAAMFGGPHGRAGTLPRAGAAPAADDAGVPGGDWHAYGRTDHGNRYSPLAEITPENVADLQVAWTYRTGDMPQPGDPNETTFELTPLKVGDKVFICTPHDYAIALDAETGRELWRHDPQIKVSKELQHLTCRGVSYHAAAPEQAAAAGDCSARIFLPTADARLIALNAETGQPCPGFGENGHVDLWRGMPDLQPGFYYSTSPPVVAHDLVIIAGNVSDNVSTTEPSGVIRAYDVFTGRLVWNMDPGEPDSTEPIGPGETYTHNSPNSWSISSADEELGMIYLPMGNATPDQWGGHRTPNMERFSSAILALDIDTGQVRWVYQTVHHDLWDMDIGGQPNLVDLDVRGRTVPALVASTKRGDLFVLDRRTGEPIFPAPERPVPQGAAEGDHTAPTQPFSSVTFAPPRPLEGRDMWGATMFDQLYCRIRFHRLRYEGIFTPPSVRGSLVYPGNFGVFDWGGIAVDPARQVAFAAPSYFAFYSRLIPRGRQQQENRPADIQSPAGGSDMQGGADELGVNPNYGAPFAVDMGPLVSPLGLPCQAPPWGYVAGVDLRTGEIAYMHKNGTVRDQSPVPLPFKMGVPALGGPIITAGGVAFLTGTIDYYVRAYDVTTGRQLWQDRLPAGGQATPMTYRAPSGRQILLVPAGGHGSLGTKQGDYLIAYALPRGGQSSRTSRR